MDFRELGSFNHALLYKQGWRLLEFLNSLVACMLKARYFLDTDFLQASHGDYPSFTWLSILWGRELLQLGLHLHICEGRLVRIYGDSWIRHARVFTAQSWAILDPDARVSELLTASGGWDIPKIYQVFNFLEEELVISIPISLDRRMWHFKSNGRYSVKSGYWVANEHQRLASTTAADWPSSSSVNKLWKHLWKLKVPPKNFLFLWRFVQNILPSRDVLYRLRRLITDVVCFRCLTALETSTHAMFDCDSSRQAWEGVGLSVMPLISQSHEPKSLLVAALGVFSGDQLPVFAITVWLL
ncbi:hypothetical protein GBA52_010433 [Prunus armeniaca]|nr:hypothetical protein GBA52_010433 [Prunus armeniaca]